MSNKPQYDRRRFVRDAAMLIAGGQLRMASWASVAGSTRIKLPVEGSMAALGDATEWLNSPAVTASHLRGKVVLVDFWTYTCVDWRRTLPCLRTWAKKYKDQGLVVIGVHTPEFSFEHDVDNVRWAVKKMDINYPVVIDNRRAIWDAFHNEYWPALYFVDACGRVRHHQFGEGS